MQNLAAGTSLWAEFTSSAGREAGPCLGETTKLQSFVLTMFNHYRLPHVMYYLALKEADEGDEEMRDCEKQRGKVDE